MNNCSGPFCIIKTFSPSQTLNYSFDGEINACVCCWFLNWNLMMPLVSYYKLQVKSEKLENSNVNLKKQIFVIRYIFQKNASQTFFVMCLACICSSKYFIWIPMSQRILFSVKGCKEKRRFAEWWANYLCLLRLTISAREDTGKLKCPHWTNTVTF